MYVFADALALGLAAGAMALVLWLGWGLTPYAWPLVTAGCGWLVFRWACGLYPPEGISPVEELRRSCRTSATGGFVHLGMLASIGLLETERFLMLALWSLAPPLAYFARAAVLHNLDRLRASGKACVIVGAGQIGHDILSQLQREPEFRLVPVGIFSDLARRGAHIEGVPVLGSVADAETFVYPYPVRHVILALTPDGTDLHRTTRLASKLSHVYAKVQIISATSGVANMLVTARPIGAYLSLEMGQPRFSARQRSVKRIVDILVAAPALLLAAPIVAIAAVLVKIVSPGPAFFSQMREGLDGTPIRIWKVRTMVMNAEVRLAEYLSTHPAARFEYERTLKLRNDPRVIPKIGRFLRKMSIDELPQLLNVLKGQLSLVGPRVMLAHEVQRFSATGQRLRREVPPGITGLWQVLYRNNSDLEVWERADSYYVSNWSVWLDLWILLRTVKIVLTGAGAF